MRNHRGIIWCRTQFPGPHKGILHQADEFLGHPRSKEQLNLLCLSNNNLGHGQIISNNSLDQGQILSNPAVRMVIIIVSLAEVLRTLPEIVLVTRSLSKARMLLRTTKARAKSKLCKSGKGRSTLLLLLNFRRAPQSCRVHSLTIISLQLYCLILVQPIALSVINLGQDWD